MTDSILDIAVIGEGRSEIIGYLRVRSRGIGMQCGSPSSEDEGSYIIPRSIHEGELTSDSPLPNGDFTSQGE